MEKREICYAGSFTVEASLLMSVILMVLFLILQVTLFLTDTTRMTAVLAENCSEMLLEEKQLPEVSGFFYLDPRSVTVREGTSSVTASCSGGTVSLGYGWELPVNLQQEKKIRKPVEYVWRIHALCDGRK